MASVKLLETLSSAIFCVFLTLQWAPAPVNILGTVIATLLVTAVVIWAVSWWRARKLGY